jgi:hypothetical protein
MEAIANAKDRLWSSAGDEVDRAQPKPLQMKKPQSKEAVPSLATAAARVRREAASSFSNHGGALVGWSILGAFGICRSAAM